MLIQGTVAVEMVPCATYAVRSAEWVPAFDGSPAHLVIRQQRKAGCKEYADVYGVEEQHTGNPAVREFLLEKTTDDTPDSYRVVIGNGWQSCTCTAANAKNICKHRDSLLCLLATGEV